MEKSSGEKQLIGIFDSGVGGLSVLREIRHLLPGAPLYYIADQAHVPYGKKSLDEIRELSFGITRFLIDIGAGLIVVACNTASAAALKELRQVHPDIPFIGMEPAVKPATLHTRNGVVGVLATPATFQGKMYSTLVERFANEVQILTSTLPGLVEEIEAGNLDTPATRQILETAIRPMVTQGADTLVLGCTHFPFVLPLIREIAGTDVEVIDPAPAIARRTAFLLEERSIHFGANLKESITFATTASTERYKITIKQLLNKDIEPVQLNWRIDLYELSKERK